MRDVDTDRPRAPGRQRPGRWRTGEESRRRILDAARACFGELGYDRATVRQIASRARVDPAMVYYFFATKSGLFATAMEFPVNPAGQIASLLADGVDDLGSRIVRHFLAVWDGAGTVGPLFALLRSAPTDERSATMLGQFVQRELVAQLRRAIGGRDAELRAELVGSHLMGMALARYVVRIEPLASAPADAVVRWMGPVLQRYLDRP